MITLSTFPSLTETACAVAKISFIPLPMKQGLTFGTFQERRLSVQATFIYNVGEIDTKFASV